ncbi:MAG TPA: PEP-CTERM sorting domain-containing protein [Verrucomicrobiae bacterium]|nr:PEP-CTERM sorting domain-containing protein [Verrucomicrobiae bacterium]
MTTSKKSALISTVATLLAVVVLARPGVAQSYNAATDFSAVNNPNGAWSYGYTFGLGTSFLLNTSNTAAYAPGVPLSGWLNSTGNGGIPYALHNGTAGLVTNNTSTVYQPGQLAEQPGASNAYSVIRWTAPFSGTFNIAATFSGLSSAGDSADVHILHDGLSIFNSTVSPGPTSYSGLQSIIAGDTIDFAVGNGGNGPNEDTTALSASIVPEPGTLGLVGMGLGCLLSFRFLKRK